MQSSRPSPQRGWGVGVGVFRLHEREKEAMMEISFPNIYLCNFIPLGVKQEIGLAVVGEELGGGEDSHPLA